MNEQTLPQKPAPEQKPGLIITPQTELTLNNMAGWTKFISIIGFIEIIFMVLIGIVFFFSPSASRGAFNGMFIGLIYLIYAAILFFPPYFLYQYSNKIKAALRFKNQNNFEEALAQLKNFFTYTGVLLLIGLIFIVIGMVIGIFGLLLH